MIGYTELLIEDASGGRNAPALDPLRHIHSAAKASLVDTNLALANKMEVSRGELDTILKSAMFEPEHWQRALYSPPFKGSVMTGSGARCSA